MQRDAGKAGPAEDTDVVRRCQRVNRVVDNRENQVVQDLDDAGRRRELRIGDLQVQSRREGERECDSDERSAERREDVEAHNRLHGSAGIRILLSQSVHDEHEDEDRCDALEGTDEEIAEHRDGRYSLRRSQRNDDADDETSSNQLDERCLPVFLTNLMEHMNPPCRTFGTLWTPKAP